MTVPITFKITTNGKLLLTGEYFVLDGAKALAVPTRQGQLFEVKAVKSTSILHWRSFDEKKKCWFEAKFSLDTLDTLEILYSSDEAVALQLISILKAAQKESKKTFLPHTGLLVETHLAFPRKWGLGSSSTLIAAIAEWFEVDPYQLLFNSFGGSGYDIACALHHQAILYQLKDGYPIIETCHFAPAFKGQLYFVYLGKKQNSREGIQRYRKIGKKDDHLIQDISHLTMAIFESKTLHSFEELIIQHEELIAKHLQLTPAKELHFKNFPGVIKSLGAWGGDFVLATSPFGEKETNDWFSQRGYDTILKYDEMILN